MAADRIAKQQNATVPRDLRSGERGPHILGDPSMKNIFAGVVRAAERQTQGRKSGLCGGAGRARAVRTHGVPGQAMRDQDYCLGPFDCREEPSQTHLPHSWIFYYCPKQSGLWPGWRMEQGQERWRDSPKVPPDLFREPPRRQRIQAVSPNALRSDIAWQGRFLFRSHLLPSLLSFPDIEDAKQLFIPSYRYRCNTPSR